MGKNANQIATWKDLNDYGFIIPSDKQSSLECVTYGDVNGLNSTNLGISFNISYYTHTPGANVNTGVAPDKINTTNTNITASQTDTIGARYWVYRFQPTNVGLACIKSATCPIKYSLYHTSSSRYAGSLQARMLVYNGDGSKPIGSALITGSWKNLKTWSNASVTSGSSYAINQSFSFDYSTTEADFSNIDDTNKYFYICVEFRIVSSSGNSCNMRMVSTYPNNYTGTLSNITFYSSKKCIPYQFIIQKNPTKTIECVLIDNVPGKLRADIIKFYHKYKINNIEYRDELGSVQIVDEDDNNGEISSKTCNMPIIPKPSVSGTLQESYLYVYCGETSLNRNFTCTVYYQDGTSNVISQSGKSCDMLLGGYSNIIKKIIKIEIDVSN